MYRAYKYKLSPTQDQLRQLAQAAGNCRWVYNEALAFREEAYKRGVKVSAYDLIKRLPALKKEYEWLKLGSSQALQQVLLDLDKAYQGFFKHGRGFPKFKSKHGKQSFRIMPHEFDLPWTDDGSNAEHGWGKHTWIRLPKIGYVKVAEHRFIPEDAEIRHATLSRNAIGQWFISITCKLPDLVDDYIDPEKAAQNSVGIDFGLKSFLTLSNGETVESVNHYRRMEQQLARLQRKFARKAKGSNNREKLRMRIAKLHLRIANLRKDFLHKLSHRLSKTYDLVTVESLNIKGMVKNRCLAKSTITQGWSQFVSYLSYKLDNLGKYLVFADRWFASSRLSYWTGEKSECLTLADRAWTDSDGNVLDRDVNAAMNLDYVGQHFITTGELLTTKGYQALYG